MKSTVILDSYLICVISAFHLNFNKDCFVHELCGHNNYLKKNMSIAILLLTYLSIYEYYILNLFQIMVQ